MIPTAEKRNTLWRKRVYERDVDLAENRTFQSHKGEKETRGVHEGRGGTIGKKGASKPF